MGLATAKRVRRGGRRRRARRHRRGRAARGDRGADRGRSGGDRRRLRRGRRGAGRRDGRAHGRRPSAGWTWRSTTPASSAIRATSPTSRPRASTGDRGQPARRLELHEARAAPDAHAGQRRDRQLLLARRPGRGAGPRVLPRGQARRDRADQERRDRLRAARHPHQRRLPGRDRHADGRRHDPRPARGDEAVHARSADRPARPRRRGRRGGALAVQPRRQLRARCRAAGRRRLRRARGREARHPRPARSSGARVQQHVV